MARQTHSTSMCGAGDFSGCLLLCYALGMDNFEPDVYWEPALRGPVPPEGLRPGERYLVVIEDC